MGWKTCQCWRAASLERGPSSVRLDDMHRRRFRSGDVHASSPLALDRRDGGAALVNFRFVGLVAAKT